MLLSVIIPVKNGEATLDKCLASIYSQSIAQNIEVIILDSTSTDNSLEICSKYKVRIIHVKPSEFNHGTTRNVGVALAKGSLVYFTVQDAEIAEPDMLERMVRYFNDSLVSGVVGMQAIPAHLDKDPAVWFKRISVPEVETRHFPSGSFKILSSEQQYQLSNWDNVNAMYRKQALIEIPFRHTNFSEDWFWAYDALAAGMKLIRDPSCVTFHYHHQYFLYVFRVNYILNYNHYLFFKVLPKLNFVFAPLLRAVYRILKNDSLSLKQKLYWSSHNTFKIVGYSLSVLIFRIMFFSLQERGLDVSYSLFCKEVPQGAVNK